MTVPIALVFLSGLFFGIALTYACQGIAKWWGSARRWEEGEPGEDEMVAKLRGRAHEPSTAGMREALMKTQALKASAAQDWTSREDALVAKLRAEHEAAKQPLPEAVIAQVRELVEERKGVPAVAQELIELGRKSAYDLTREEAIAEMQRLRTADHMHPSERWSRMVTINMVHNLWDESNPMKVTKSGQGDASTIIYSVGETTFTGKEDPA